MAADRGPIRQPRPAWATLEFIIARLAATGRLSMLTLTKSEDRYNSALQRPDRKAYNCAVKRNAVEALLDALGPHAFQSWEEHLGWPEAAAWVTYWYHPESDSLIVIQPGETFPSDPLCEQIDAAGYALIKSRQEAAGVDDDDDGSHLI